jgi:hypothetical protein
MELICLVLFSVVDADGHSDLSLSLTLVQLFLNMVIHLYTLHCNKALFPYYIEIQWWISAPGTP